MEKYIIGLDLGINNVGWSIINQQTNEIVDYGVVRYTESSNAQDRRNYRATRRLRNRRQHRIERLSLLFKKFDIPTERTIEENLLQKRINGLESELTWQEIINIVYYFAFHRGYIPFDDVKNERETVNLTDNQFPCHFIMEEYSKFGKYRNSNKLIKCDDNIKELKAILINQKKYHNFITDELIDSIIDIITSKRKFYEGPGGPREDQLTPFGRYKSKEDLERYIKDKNYNKYLYEGLIGKCKIALGEPCAPKWNYFAEEFNLLNDFINMKVKEEYIDSLPKEHYHKINKYGKFSRETILEIKEYILQKDVINLDSLFTHVLGVKIDAIEGYRIDKNKRPEISKFEFYKYIVKQFKNANLYPSWLKDDNKSIYNKIIYVLTVVPSSFQINEMLIDRIKDYSFTNEEIKILKDIKTKKSNDLKSYHALSEKVLKRTLNDMDNDNYQSNFMKIKRDNNYEKEADEYFEKNYTKNKKGPYLIEDKYVDDIIANPQVKKTIRKAIKIINAVITKYKKYPTIIAIESTREMNAKAKRDEIVKSQKLYEDRRKETKEFLKQSGIIINETNISKAICYKETEGHCIYCHKPIPINDLTTLEIEHILPVSKSFDDSFDNLTCSCLKCNKEKGDLTPYYFLKNEYDKFKTRVLSYKISEAKRDNLLYEGDISKHELKFINRNLRDVSYGTVALNEEIHRFNKFLNFKENTLIKVVTLPGQLTSKIRRRIDLDEKDRSKLFHHAVDATIIASIANTEIGEILVKSQNERDFWVKNKQTVHLLPKLIKLVNIKNIGIIKNINEDNIKRSFEVKKNPKQSIANANVIKIIKEKDQFYKVQQITNIYNLDLKKDQTKLDKLFNEFDNTMVLLCQHEDPNLFKKLKAIYSEYKDKSRNPFLDYCIYGYGLEINKTEFNYLVHGIKKSDNKENSPIVKTLRYKERITNPYLLKKHTTNRKKNNSNEFIKPIIKEKTLIGLDSLTQYCTDIYYNDANNRFIFIPVYTVSVDLNNKKINRKERYYLETYNRLIGNTNANIKYIGTIFNGEWCKIFKKNDKILDGRYIGYHKTNNILVFGLNGSFEKLETFNMTTLDNRIIIYTTDILGKKYKRLDSQDYM